MGTCLLTHLVSLVLLDWLLTDGNAIEVYFRPPRYGSDSEFWIKEWKGELGSHADPDWRYPGRNQSQMLGMGSLLYGPYCRDVCVRLSPELSEELHHSAVQNCRCWLPLHDSEAEHMVPDQLGVRQQQEFGESREGERRYWIAMVVPEGTDVAVCTAPG
jgi:hypothetical protein